MYPSIRLLPTKMKTRLHHTINGKASVQYFRSQETELEYILWDSSAPCHVDHPTLETALCEDRVLDGPASEDQGPCPGPGPYTLPPLKRLRGTVPKSSIQCVRCKHATRPSSVPLNLVSSSLVLKQDLQYKLTVHLRLNVFNDETTLNSNSARRQLFCHAREWST